MKAQCDTCIEMHILAAYIDNESIGTIISENDLIDAGQKKLGFLFRVFVCLFLFFFVRDHSLFFVGGFLRCFSSSLYL